MKKSCIIFLLSIIISVTALGFSGVLGINTQNGHTMYEVNEQNAYLRIHIRADSNEEKAQAVKYQVRDNVVEYLTPLVANYQTKAEAMQGVAVHLDEIAQIATKTLEKQGFSYGAEAELKKESFPTRIYGEFTLPAGEYSALILRLGAGKGDNWWCVVYPPLCFAAPTGQNVIYKSKIKEIIQNFQK
jgi:stage II sporulation protein R